MYWFKLFVLIVLLGASQTGKVLEKSRETPNAAPEKSSVKLPDEQLSKAEMELRIKLLQEDR